jgi:hypothetical protein
VKFDLGKDTGLKHQYVDRDVINGQRYFYAVTAYDFGYEAARFAPSETPIQVSVANDGTITHGKNVAVVRPSAAAAGYLPPEVASFRHAAGGATGVVGFDIVDPKQIKNGNEYEISFKDTLFKVNNKDVFQTRAFSLRNITENRFLLKDDARVAPGDEISITEGFRLTLDNVQSLSLNTSRTGWNNPDVYSFDFSTVSIRLTQGTQNPCDYMIVFGNVGMATSKDTTVSGRTFSAKPVNFKVINTTQNKAIEFVFGENDGSDGRLTIDPTTGNVDAIYFLEQDQTGKKMFTWQFVLNLKGKRNPQAGDTVSIILNKPFLSYDTYQFLMKGSSISSDKASNDLSRIRVVPNPYIAAETWEPRNTYTSGRGPREIHFINLPSRCTIRIFNVAGALVRKIEHESAFEDGTEIWDVLSEEKFEIAYGVYVYHIEAPGIGTKTGTFAVIK